MMKGPLFTYRRRLARAFTTWPAPRRWLEVVGLYLAFAVPALPLALAADLVNGPETWLGPGSAWWLLPGALFWPSLLEETVFRVMLFPHPREVMNPVRRWGWGAASLALYVVAHPLNAWLFRPDTRGVFDAPAFLLVATLLGALNLVVYHRTGSVWPPVLVHWLTVAPWLYFGGKALLTG